MNRILCSVPARYVLTFLGFIGSVNLYAQRVNINVAILAMVKGTSSATNATISRDCPRDGTSNVTDYSEKGEFLWNQYDQGMILGAYFYGYIIPQIPAGRLAERIGGKWLFGLGVLISSIFTLLTPVAARLDTWALTAVRILIGFAQGATFPAMHILLARWMPKSQRALLSSIVYSGMQMGAVIAMPITAIFCDVNSLGSWPTAFYFFGALGCIWFIFWIMVIYETPSEHPRIAQKELSYILESQGAEQAKMNKPEIPWLKILSSIPVWVLMVTHFGQNWGQYMLLTELPTYMERILDFELKSNGALSALPNLLQVIVGWIAAYGADFVRKKNYFTISVIRKSCNTIAFIGPAACLLGVTFARCDATLSVALFALSMAFNGFSYSGYVVTHVEMSPDFAGTLMGMTNCFGNISGFLITTTVSGLTQDNETLYRWGLVFYITVAIYVFTSILFVVFGSAELQPWGIASIPPAEETQVKNSSIEHDSVTNNRAKETSNN